MVLVSKGVVLVLVFKEKFSAGLGIGLGLEGCGLGLGIDTPRSYYNPVTYLRSLRIHATWKFDHCDKRNVMKFMSYMLMM